MAGGRDRNGTRVANSGNEERHEWVKEVCKDVAQLPVKEERLLDGNGASAMNSAGDWKSTATTGRRENEDGSRPGGLRAMAMLLGVQHLLVTWLGKRCVSQAREDGRKRSAGGHQRGSKQAVSPALL
jgi:hypothetical protein